MTLFESQPREEASSLAQAANQLMIVETIRKFGGHVEVAFIGDSLTQNFQWSAPWQLLFGHRRILNFGLGGDTTKNLLWRLERGLLRGLAVEKVVIQIGINDCWAQPSPPELVRRIETCINLIAAECPSAQIFLYGLFPVGQELEKFQALICEVNEQLRKFAQRRELVFRDFGNEFFDQSGKADARNFSDGCHLTEFAYKRWAADLENVLWKQGLIREQTVRTSFSV